MNNGNDKIMVTIYGKNIYINDAPATTKSVIQGTGSEETEERGQRKDNKRSQALRDNTGERISSSRGVKVPLAQHFNR